MSEQVAKAVLAKASAIDPTMPTPNTTTALGWAEQLGGINMAEALEAVRMHYAASSDRLMPSHVLGYVKRIRREEAEQENARRLREAAAWNRNLPAGSDPYDGTRNSDELEMLHEAVNSSGACTYCHEPKDKRCRNNGVATKIPHFARLKQARAAGVDY